MLSLPPYKNAIKAGGSTARAQNVDWMDGWMDGWVIPDRLLRLLEHLAVLKTQIILTCEK